MQRRKGLFRKCFVGNLLSRRPTSRTSFKWAGNIRMDCQETGWEGVNRTQVAKNRTLCIVIIWYWTPEFHKSRDLTKLKTISIAQKMPCNSELVYTIKREIWGLGMGNMLHSVPCGILIHFNRMERFYPWNEDTPFTESLKAVIQWQWILMPHELHAGVFDCQVSVVHWFREPHCQCIPSLQEQLSFWCHMATSAMHRVHAAWTVITLHKHHTLLFWLIKYPHK
jgi:hypothetical protein